MNKEEEEILRKKIQQRMREDKLLEVKVKMELLQDVVRHIDMIKYSYDSKAALETAINSFIGSLERHDIKYDKENNTYYLTKDQLTGELIEDFVFRTGRK
jgi:hypothetical protein